MDRSITWRSGAVQTASVVAISLLLAALLPSSFFEDWGWLSGPAAWALCALLTARVLALPPGLTLLGAALAGIPSMGAVLAGIHWLGVLVAVVVFAVWCGTVARPTIPVSDGPR